MKIKRVEPFCFLLILILSLLSACGGGEENRSKLSPDATILAFGDSITAGYGAGEGEDYPAQLAALSGINVVNAGVSGETTSEGLPRFKEVVADVQPDVILLLEGGNDILQNQDLAITKANLQEMIGFAEEQNIPVVFFGVPEKKLLSSTAPLYGELAEAHALVYMPDLLADLLRKPSLKSDMIHLNGEGYGVMAEEIYEKLQDEGLL